MIAREFLHTRARGNEGGGGEAERQPRVPLWERALPTIIHPGPGAGTGIGTALIALRLPPFCVSGLPLIRCPIVMSVRQEPNRAIEMLAMDREVPCDEFIIYHVGLAWWITHQAEGRLE